MNASVRMRFGEDTGAGCQTPRLTRATPNSTVHEIVVYGMKESTTYDLRAVAIPEGGGAEVNSVCQGETTGALAFDDEADLPNLGAVGITTSGAAVQVNNFLTIYGCHNSANTSAGSRNAFVIVDNLGNIVWYQDPTLDLPLSDPAQDFLIEGMSLSRPDKHVLGIIDKQIIVEYDLEGNLLRLFCRDDGTGYCPNTTATPDLFFDGYVHHDVQKVNDVIYALSAVEATVPDEDNCDNDTGTTDAPIVLDGLYTIDVSGAPSLTEWDWTDAGETVDYTVASKPCSSGYWADKIDGADYMHTNSFWIDVANQWTFSLHNLNQVWWVDADPLSGTYNTVVLDLDGSGSSGDYTNFVGGGYPEAFSGQHTVHWGPGSGAEMFLFDNQYDEHGAVPSRGVEYDVSSPPDLEAVAQYTLKNTSGTGVYCETGGDAFGMLGGDVYAMCPKTGGGVASYSVFNEFSASDTIELTVQLQCDFANDYTIAGTAYRAYANVY